MLLTQKTIKNQKYYKLFSYGKQKILTNRQCLCLCILTMVYSCLNYNCVQFIKCKIWIFQKIFPSGFTLLRRTPPRFQHLQLKRCIKGEALRTRQSLKNRSRNFIYQYNYRCIITTNVKKHRKLSRKQKKILISLLMRIYIF